MEPRYPKIFVKLSGEDGNAIAILGATQKAMKRAGVLPEQVKEYQTEAMSGDYDHLIQTTMRWVTVE